MADAIASVGIHKFFILNTQQATKTVFPTDWMVNLQRFSSEVAEKIEQLNELHNTINWETTQWNLEQ